MRPRLAPRLAMWLLPLQLAAVGCSATAVVARPSPFPGAVAAAEARPESLAAAATAVTNALALRGIPYRLGGDRPETGVDCSGLVRYAFLQAQIQLPRTVLEQFEMGRRVGSDDVEPGDLVFFDTTSPGPSHVGIVLDHETFIHAPGTGRAVRVEQLANPYWVHRLRGVRRIAGTVPSTHVQEGR